MDLKFNGNWVGNIYQRFETMCQDVDNFVSKESVKHVQSVGESVKKLYSGVVEDILPPLVNPVRQATQVLPLQQFDSLGTYARSTVKNEENSVVTDTNESFTKHVPRKDLTFPSNRILNKHCLDNINTLDEINNTGMKALVPVPTTIDGRSSQEEQLSWDWSSDTDSDAPEYENAEGDAVNTIDPNVVVDENTMGDGADNMSKASLDSAPVDEISENDILTKGALSTSILRFHADEIPCKSFLCEVEVDINTSSVLHNSVTSSVDYCDSKFESSNSPAIESLCLSDFPRTKCLKEADIFCCDSADAMGCWSDFPIEVSASSLALAFDDEEADVPSSRILSLESDDVHTTVKSDEAVYTAEYSGIKHEQYFGFVPFEASLETGIEDNSIIDVADPSLETIDLSDKGKLDDSWGFISEDNWSNAYTFRARRHRSYKKIIQDALASRKRLTKEYTQLGLLYGDIDIDSSLYQQQNALASNSEIPLESKESHKEDLCDSEWELL